jgi:hypothetical protein
MATKTISQLTASGGAALTDLFEAETGAGASRKLTLAQMFALSTGAVTADTPLLNMAQTWNNAAVTFTGWKLNVTDTASAAASLLADFQVGGVSKLSVSKGGQLRSGAGSSGDAAYGDPSGNAGLYFNGSAGSSIWFTANNTYRMGLNESTFGMAQSQLFGWESSGAASALDVVLQRDAANTLALRNGTPAQTFNIYNTYADESNYRRLRFQTGSAFTQINAEGSGTGVVNDLYLNVAGPSNTGVMEFRIKDGAIWRITNAGHFLAATDNTHDIGASGATRPRNIYAGTSITAPTVSVGSGVLDFSSASSRIDWAGQSRIYNSSNGVLRLSDNAATSFDRLQFGGTTSSFPALKRSAATLQVRLADDSAYAELAASLIDFQTGGTVPGTASYDAGTLPNIPVYGTAATLLGDPANWIRVKLGGSTYVIPAYIQA